MHKIALQKFPYLWCTGTAHAFLDIGIQHLTTFHRKFFTLERAFPVSVGHDELDVVVASSVEITNATTTACPPSLRSSGQLSRRVDVSQVGSNDVNTRDATCFWLSEWRKYMFLAFTVDIETNVSISE